MFIRDYFIYGISSIVGYYPLLCSTVAAAWKIVSFRGLGVRVSKEIGELASLERKPWKQNEQSMTLYIPGDLEISRSRLQQRSQAFLR